MKKIIFVVFILYLLVILVIYRFTSQPLKLYEAKIGDITGQVPVADVENYNKNGWKGKVYTTTVMRLRILYKTASKPVEYAENLTKKYIHREGMRVFPIHIENREWAYGFMSRDKGYKILVVFPLKDKVYWVELTSSSEIERYKRCVDTFLTSMKVDGMEIGGKLIEDIARIKLPKTAVQSPGDILLFSGIGLFLGILAISIVFYIGYRRPVDLPHGIVKELKTGMTLLRGKGRTNLPCLLVIAENRLYCYSFGKKVFDKEIGEGCYIQGKRLVVELQEGKAFIELPRPDEFRIWFPLRER